MIKKKVFVLFFVLAFAFLIVAQEEEKEVEEVDIDKLIDDFSKIGSTSQVEGTVELLSGLSETGRKDFFGSLAKKSEIESLANTRLYLQPPAGGKYWPHGERSLGIRRYSGWTIPARWQW